MLNARAFETTGVSIICLTVCWDADQRKHQGSASLTFVRRIIRWRVVSPQKRPFTRKAFPFDDVIMFAHGSCFVVFSFDSTSQIYLDYRVGKGDRYYTTDPVLSSETTLTNVGERITWILSGLWYNTATRSAKRWAYLMGHNVNYMTETLSISVALCGGNPRTTGGFPSHSQ